MKSEDVVKLLKERYAFDKGYVTLAECSPPGGQRRYDALAVSVWASHGYSVDGFEIKVARSDFLAEINNPAKSAPLHRWCNRWWMVCPLDVGRPEECPPEWGFLAVQADGKSLRQVRRPKSVEPQERGDAWWATLLLRQGTRDRFTTSELRDAESKGWSEGHARGAESSANEVVRLTERLKDAQKSVSDFEAASGICISSWIQPKSLGLAVHALLSRGGLDSIAKSIERDAEHLKTIAEGLKDVIGARPEAPRMETQQEKSA